ncbi:ROK family transcriptional regulator [Carboxydothermus pertinax]|nr:ROK family transcriptional regulator [Carboxydothermus pertinax]
MYRNIKGNSKMIKKLNTTRVFWAIYRAGEISRVELAEVTGLTKPTISFVVERLLNHGLIIQTGYGQSTGGRKPEKLRINPAGAYFIGVKIGNKGITGIVTNLLGEIIQEERIFWEGETRETALKKIEKVIEKLLKKVPKPTGIGFALPGQVDYEKGVALSAHNLPFWREVPLKEVITARFGLPVIIEHDARAMAIAEKWFGEGQDLSNFLYIKIGQGIGAGIMLMGKPYKGFKGRAGEIGHMKVTDDRSVVCTCGQTGCLEATVAGKALPRLVDLFDSALPKDFNVLLLKATNGEEKCVSFFKWWGELLGRGIANLVNIFNPEKIFLGGEVTRAWEFLEEGFWQGLKGNSLIALQEGLEIKLSKIHEKAEALGACAAFLEEMQDFQKFSLLKGEENDEKEA